MTGIEPAYLAWEASALPLSYIGLHPAKTANQVVLDYFTRPVRYGFFRVAI